MNKSESLTAIATALSAAQGEIENASKNAANPHFQSKYADLAEILNTVRPVFAKHGLSVTQGPSYENGIVSVETVLMHKSGEWMSSTISAPVSKQDAQGVGSAITYCRRYAIAAVAGLAQEDDDAESAIGRGRQSQQSAPAPAAGKEREAINDRIRHTLFAMGCKTAAEAGAKVKQMTTFEKDGKTVPGKEDYKALSDKAAKYLAERLESELEDKPEMCSECRQPISQGHAETCPHYEPF